MDIREDNNLLVIIIDVLHHEKLSFQQCIKQLTVFINAYLLSNHYNTVGIILCHQLGSTLIYPCNKVVEYVNNDDKKTGGIYEPLGIINEIINNEIKLLMINILETFQQVSSSTLLSCALSTSLCYIQRCIRQGRTGITINPRILVIRADNDNVTQHVQIMNCIFAAQKQNIPIDTCVLNEHSTYLQQATDITGGVYIHIPDSQELLQYLMWIFLFDVKFRLIINLPKSQCVDYRAGCFCHHKLIDVGFVCSVCLAVLCNFVPICPVCQTHFKLPTFSLNKLKKKGKGKNKIKS